MSEYEGHKRWLAIATYDAKPMPYVQIHEIEELGELQSLIEQGPDWKTLQSITVTYGIKSPPPTT